MPDTNVTAAPFVLQHAIVHLGAVGSGTFIECAVTNLVCEANADENVVETFCGKYKNYKKADWTVTATIAQSYGASGSWTLIHPLCETIVPFYVKPATGTGSIDNPVMSGTAYVAPLSFIDAAPGEVSEVDLALGVQGTPTFGITEPTSAEAGGTETEPEPVA